MKYARVVLKIERAGKNTFASGGKFEDGREFKLLAFSLSFAGRTPT